jgi:hypothetical protein
VRINGIRIEHVLQIRDIDVALKHPITIFAGDNNVGKTSIHEAIRIAFTGEAARVKQKKDYGALLRSGAKTGSAIVEFQHAGKTGRATAIFPSIKQECSPPAPPELPYILDAPRFGAMDDTARRRFLFDLFGVRANVQAVSERMANKGCADDLIKIVIPMLRGGFEPAEKYAIEQQQQWRANWKAITGETYGEVKAETWKAPLSMAEINKEGIAGFASTIATLTEEHSGMQREIGAARAYLTSKERHDREAVNLKGKASNLAKLKREVETTEKAIPKARAKSEQSKAKLSTARLSGQPCPSCGTILAVKEGGKIVEVAVQKPSQVAAQEAEAQQDDAALRTFEQTLETVRQQFQESMAAASQLSAMEQAMDNPTTPEKLAELVEGADSLTNEIADFAEKKRQLENSVAEVEAAKKSTEQARQAHLKFKAWSVIRDVLSPEGIPGEILEETLGPLNTRLKASAELGNWPVPQLRGDMEILVNGLPYGLQGESVRWRVDAMIAEGIANASNLKLLVLDRIDVLSIGRRGELLDWCYQLVESQGYESILLFGTLKEKPKIDDANVFWLQDGRVA